MKLKEKLALWKRQREIKHRKKKAQKDLDAAMARLKCAADEMQIGCAKGVEETAELFARFFRAASQSINERMQQLEPDEDDEDGDPGDG